MATLLMCYQQPTNDALIAFTAEEKGDLAGGRSGGIRAGNESTNESARL
jgi:hypothetical protein